MSNFVQLRWKDQNIEDLASFRKFLLHIFESYNGIWTFLTRDVKFSMADIKNGIEALVKEHQIFPDQEDHEETAKKISDAWGSERNLTGVGISDVHYLIDHKPRNPMLAKLREWALDHEDFNEIHELWSGLTRNCEVEMDQFIDGFKIIIPDFDPGLAGKNEEIVSFIRKLFRMFDAQESGGISRAEIAPATGERMEDNDNAILEYKVPLTYFTTVTLLKSVNKISFRLGPRFVDKKEWRALRLALDPDWKCMDIYEERLEVTCREEYFELWNAVVEDADMEKKQSFIRHYDGAVVDHNFVGGIMMRQGLGEQKWGDGRFYKGNFEAHMPHGDGDLWVNQEEAEDEEKVPIYRGGWSNGKKQGSGKYFFEQETTDPGKRRSVMALLATTQTKKGIKKVYEGGFRDDLFHGQGKLYVENSVIAKVPNLDKSAKDKSGKKYLPLPQIDPAQMLSFEGEFRSDWQETRKYLNAEFGLEWPESKHYDIDKIPDMEDENGKKLFKFWRFLPVDNRNLQLAGAAPYEFGLDVYSMKAGEKLHMYKGTALYADNTIYSGEMKMGKFHGFGKLTQRKEDEQYPGEFEMLYEYEGNWKEGLRHGYGSANDNTTKITYVGQYTTDLKDGRGKQVMPPDRWESAGYKFYDGDWVMDRREGYGAMMMPTDILYRGGYIDNLREGHGALYLAEELGQQGPGKEISVSYESYEEAINDVQFVGGELGDVIVDGVFTPGKGMDRGEVEISADGGGTGKAGKAAKKAKKKKGEEEAEKAAAGAAVDGGATANRPAKAHAAGVQVGWQLRGINQDKRDYLDLPGDELLRRYADEKDKRTQDQVLQHKVKLIFSEPDKPMYKGGFKGDKFHSTAEDRCWFLCSDNALFYGMILSDGTREGDGVLYKADLQKRNVSLRKAWFTGVPYKCNLPEDRKHEEISYTGNWVNDVQKGEGTSYHDTGVYTGQFKDGKRHGRGRWETHGGRWKYYAGTDPTHTNFDVDKMHGIATVEDDRYIHENVIFVNDKCMMPFTVKGPPISGFDNHPLFGTIMKARAGMRANAPVVQPDETKTGEQEQVKNTGKYGLDKDETTHAFTQPDEAAVIREDTDLSLPRFRRKRVDERCLLAFVGYTRNTSIQALSRKNRPYVIDYLRTLFVHERSKKQVVYCRKSICPSITETGTADDCDGSGLCCRPQGYCRIVADLRPSHKSLQKLPKANSSRREEGNASGGSITHRRDQRRRDFSMPESDGPGWVLFATTARAVRKTCVRDGEWWTVSLLGVTEWETSIRQHRRRRSCYAGPQAARRLRFLVYLR
ncbi:unnamed protein product [Amoebophrya sp. A25]|nr:unnamed protein product [Amoebophrya sp. A25]|eukprot:GSA25T00012742001.1